MAGDATDVPVKRPPWFVKWCLALLFATHLAMLAWNAYWNGPVCDEVGHLTAGIYKWKYAKFDLYRVNPPLVQCLAAVPAVLGKPKLSWKSWIDEPAERHEWMVGQDFIWANGQDAFWYFTAGRMLCLSFSLTGTCFCYRWASELYGWASGLAAAVLWSFCPNVLGWGATFTTDVACAALGLAASYAFWRWLKAPDFWHAIIAGVALGLAELTKMTWVILFALWPVFWAFARFSGRRVDDESRQIPSAGGLLLILFLGVAVINNAYLFSGTGRRLGDFVFVSRPLAGNAGVADGGPGGNRFRDTWLGEIPVPVPEEYLRGIDLQKLDFEKGMPSYLFGVWKDRGWWYYYFVAAFVKFPLALWGLVFVCLATRIRRVTSWRLWLPSITYDEVVLLAPAVAVFALLCWESGFSRYSRYLLPCAGPVFVFVSSIFTVGAPRSFQLRRLAIGLMAWFVVSSLRVYPYSLSYFNELAGGPRGGHRILIDSNIDWGQDLFRLKAWIDEHQEARPIRVLTTGFVNAQQVGIESGWRLPYLKGNGEDRSPPAAMQPPDPPEWYAISIHEIHRQGGDLEFFLQYEPVAVIGYSIYVYRLDSGAINRRI